MGGSATGAVLQAFSKLVPTLGGTVIDWLQDRLAGRGFAFGPGTSEFKASVFGHWYVQRGQYGLSARWDVDESARTVQFKAGPVGLMVTFARTRPAVPVDWSDETSTLKIRALADGGELMTWTNWRHVGVCVEVDPRSRMWRAEAGPLGVAVMRP